MNGGNIFDLQKIPGHTKIEMTMRYSHFSPEHLQGAIKFMSFESERANYPESNHDNLQAL